MKKTADFEEGLKLGVKTGYIRSIFIASVFVLAIVILRII